jgi:8-hydroxy-5-deazaflavin:NADPH oxidoreductase
MKIAIVGVGNVGSALAGAFARAGHTILMGVRGATGEQRDLASRIGGRLLSPVEAAGAAEVVLLSLPWRAAEDAVRNLGDLAGKIVIDCMNPLGTVGGGLGLLVGHDTSGAETVAGWLPGARVVKTLNQVGAEIMADAGRLPVRPAMFMAADDAGAKGVVGSLLTDIGFDAMDAGPLRLARILEPYAMVWINQAMLRGKGRDWALAAIHPVGGRA